MAKSISISESLVQPGDSGTEKSPDSGKESRTRSIFKWVLFRVSLAAGSRTKAGAPAT